MVARRSSATLPCAENSPGGGAEATAWLAEGPVHTQQQALKDLVRALFDAFDSAQPQKSFPVFKKKGQDDAFRYPDPDQFRLEEGNSRIFLPKLGWVRYRKSRRVEGRLCNVTVRRDGKHWFVSVQVEREVPEPVHPSTTQVGLDLGIVRFATLSDGTVYTSLSAHRRAGRRLARAQRALARKVKFSNNWKKQKNRVADLSRRVARCRVDFLHQVSHDISKNHTVIVMEDLSVRNMSRSARGTVSAPGRNVKAKAVLNRAILDQGWGEFRRQIGYKSRWRGGMQILVEPAHTSCTCSVCGHISAESRITQADFVCVNCGHEENADDNASKVILAAGRAVIACGGQSAAGAPMKQDLPGRRRSAGTGNPPAQAGGGRQCRHRRSLGCRHTHAGPRRTRRE